MTVRLVAQAKPWGYVALGPTMGAALLWPPDTSTRWRGLIEGEVVAESRVAA
jgi:hypothetical protein